MADNFFSIDHHGVPCIVPALEPDHIISVFAEQIDNLSFSFITPLVPTTTVFVTVSPFCLKKAFNNLSCLFFTYSLNNFRVMV